MPVLPSGAVTFLLTDVVGSAKLWEEQPEEMRRALARHDEIAARLIRQRHGTLVKSRGEGDSLFAVFADAAEAVLAAGDLQQALLPGKCAVDVPLCLRIALNTGQAEQRDGDYYGVAVNRCARLRAITQGCQILLSLATADLARDSLTPPYCLRDLGQHKLRDLALPERIFQVVHPALPDLFPPLPARDRSGLPNNLPQQPTSFVGREREMRLIRERLPHSPLLTLTGPGGCGKTRLALQAAAQAGEDYGDGVWLAELAALSNPKRVAQTAASLLHIREEPGRPIVETLSASLSGKSLLLVLDNCEHLIAACADLAQTLLRSCPGTRLLATSRQALGIPGETIIPVPTLSLPSLHPPASVEQLMQSESVRLFVSRAAATEPPFTVTLRNAPAVAQVCHRLDGIPLALELAAARVKVLSVEQIAQRLDDRFRLLTGGSRTGLPRQQTLRALIDWSYDLLSGAEQTLLRRLSVFAGGWTLEAAEQVCSGGSAREEDVLNLLGRLVDKSLVLVDDVEGQGRRYRLLEMVRQYSRDRREEQDDSDEARERHYAWFLALAEDAEAQLRGLDQGMWLNRLETEHDNFRAALDNCLARGSGEDYQKLAGALWHFWYIRGHWGEGQERLSRAVKIGPELTIGRAKALCGASCIAWGQDYDREARALAEESLAVSEAMGDKRSIAEALKHLGMTARRRGDYGSARALFENSLAIYRDLANPQNSAHLLCCLGEMAWLQGEFPRARALQEESLKLSHAADSQRDRGYSLTNLGNVTLAEGHPDAARPLAEEGLAIFRALGENWAIAYALWSLGNIVFGAGRLAEAGENFREALVLVRDLDSRWSIGFALTALGFLASAQGEDARAVRLLSAAQALRESIRFPLPPILRRPSESCLAALRSRLGSDQFQAAWNAGQAIMLSQAIQEALQ
jgi:predicted ATPase/class 3 adenylate cyclase